MPFLPQESSMCFLHWDGALSSVGRIRRLLREQRFSVGRVIAVPARVRRPRRVVFSRRLRPCPWKAKYSAGASFSAQ
ncbi:hypothetical protein CIL05_21730, partial [Virgibacillus profundi]